jgi:TonB family protein
MHWFSLLGASFTVHLTLILALVFLPRVFRPRLNFPDVYTVNLMSLPAGSPGPQASGAAEPKPAAAAPAPAPAPAKPKPAIKIPEKPTAKPAKPKAAVTPVKNPKPKAEEPKTAPSDTSHDDSDLPGKEASAAAPAGQASTPVPGLGAGGEGAQGGLGVGGAGGMLDDATFQYGWYISQINSIFSGNWTRPIKPDLDSTLRAIVHFRIQRDGRLTEIALKQPSGDAALDRSALRAVQDSNPLPPLPYQYPKDSLGVDFFFDIVPK